MPAIEQFCDNWVFIQDDNTDDANTQLEGEVVTLPHNAVDLPLDYFDEKSYQRPFTYQKSFDWRDTFDGKEVWLRFDGAMANAHLYVNGEFVGKHTDGYTPFKFRVTPLLVKGANLVTVVVDGSENPEIPPFGGQIDYLTYAGIYREVWLETGDAVSISNVKIETPDALAKEKSVKVRCLIENHLTGGLTGKCRVVLHDANGEPVAQDAATLTSEGAEIVLDGLKGLDVWTLDNPALYTAVIDIHGTGFSDRRVERFGFRTAEFTTEGFRLNGEPLKLMGLNRHQSVPYAGYAIGREAQERDAELVKYELGCNIVRTSHYPQSKWFLDHCDRIGLLVLEEIPGWQHIGGDVWKDEAVENVRRMIERDWNHPSIILWGVRINESPDDHAFYTRTNKLAHELDTTRQTGGIRKHMHSELLEDVYTFNDFVLGDFERPHTQEVRRGLRDREEVTGLSSAVPYLITEYNGHMYPTKASDPELRQIEHVTRHLEVLDAAHGNPAISGCIGWCMFDYNTHEDFGSGDRICHHGVMSIFREPKFAASAYASQQDPAKRVVMEPVTHWSRGERNIGGVFPLMVLTNCDFVRMCLPDGQSADIYPDTKTYPNLPHAPAILRLDDVDENILGKWGLSWPDVTFQGYIGDKCVSERKYAAGPVLTTLEVVADGDTFGADHQEMRVIVKARDQFGNTTPFVHLPVNIEVEGAASLIGPSQTTLRGGHIGFWVRSNGCPGEVSIKVSNPRLPESALHLTTVNPPKNRLSYRKDIFEQADAVKAAQ